MVRHSHKRSSKMRSGHRHRRAGGSMAKFIEPGVLLLLHEGPAHGYELADELTALLPVQRIDVGNLYRLLRKLEEAGLVTSEWDDGDTGRAKRVYELTPDGATGLDEWAQRLGSTRDALTAFLDRYAAGRDTSPDGPDAATASNDREAGEHTEG